MNTRTITTLEAEDLERAYDGSFYTISGAGGDLDEWVEGYEKMLAELADIDKPTEWFQTTGAAVNEFAGENNTNPFLDDCVLLLFPLDGLNIGALAMFKLAAGDRWFDDVIDNMRGGNE